MSKGPTPRHSKQPKPVTIDLDATDVTPKNEDLKATPSATKPSAAGKPDTAKSGEPAKPDVAKADAAKADTAKAKDASNTAAQASGGATSADTETANKEGASKQETQHDTAAAASKSPQNKTSDARPADPKPADPRDNKAGGTTPKPEAAKTTTPGSAGPASAKPQATADRKSGGGLGMVMSGVIGAVIALGGGYALQAGGVLPAPGTGGDSNAPLVSRVEALSSQVETLSQQLENSTAQAGADVPADLGARLDNLESDLAEVAARPAGSGGDPVQLGPIEERLAALENRIAELGDGASTVDPALAAEINELRAAQSGMQSALSELQSGSNAVSEKLSALESEQATLSEQVDAPARQIDLARAIAAAGLKSAIDRGGSFMSELEAFASVAPDDPAVAELRELAARGVPSRADLAAGFSDAASEAIAAANPGDPEAGLVDRLMSSAMSVVKVRKVGDIEGDNAEAITARAETRLLNGDLEAAVREWNTLPEAALAATADYGDALAARARAERLVASAVAPSGSAPTAPAASSSDTPAN
ncbi:hypothetical protein SAMN05877838_1774 [Hoeflea halophila]|uniref:Inner membrane protein n=1 Tax=Hoeflea halophila TaxID=714899 RepID=A0A286IBY8_9HYPH|nr:mitofilin family membrane protein [Hoeflea halophila]SOE16889.1 hypothetical protein SAMN05877838_1774 [Hoeflea halophila]